MGCLTLTPTRHQDQTPRLRTANLTDQIYSNFPEGTSSLHLHILHLNSLHLHISHLHILQLQILHLHIVHLPILHLDILHLHIVHLHVLHLHPVPFIILHLHILHLHLLPFIKLHLHIFASYICTSDKTYASSGKDCKSIATAKKRRAKQNNLTCRKNNSTQATHWENLM